MNKKQSDREEKSFHLMKITNHSPHLAVYILYLNQLGEYGLKKKQKKTITLTDVTANNTTWVYMLFLLLYIYIYIYIYK